MTKNDFNLIHAFIAKSFPKLELNYAMVSNDGIYATDTRKAIKFCIPMLGCSNVMAAKKVVKCVAGMADKDDIASIDANGVVHIYNEMISLDNLSLEFNPIDFDRILNEPLEYGFKLDDIDDIHFELTQKECFVDDVHLLPIIEYANCDRYVISFNKQKIDGDNINTGRVKIVGLYDIEEERDLVKFEAVVMGREFTTKAKEQLLLDI